MSSAIWQIRARAEIAFAYPIAWLGAALLTLFCVSSFAASQGAVELTLTELFQSLVDTDHRFHSVIWNVRLPRLVCAAIVGANLAVAGTLLQTTVRNPLADPGILGVSAGAGVGALIIILFFPGNSTLIPWAAFGGGLLSVTALLAMSFSRVRVTGTLRIVLSGVAVQAILFAAISLLSFAFADRAPSFTAFIVGSLNGLGWNEAQLLLAPTVIGLAIAGLMIPMLNILLLDDGVASGLGVAVQASRFATAMVAALLTASAVSVAGLIGFVGLVVPNAMRLLVGPDHRALLPLTAVGGACLVVFADTVARTSLAPIDLPVGALLSMIGGPYFLYLLWTKLT